MSKPNHLCQTATPIPRIKIFRHIVAEAFQPAQTGRLESLPHTKNRNKCRNVFLNGIISSLAMAGVAVAGDGKRSPEIDLAAPGAPLYEYAVTESVKTLMSKKEQAKLGAKARPPSPGPDYYWCEKCKTYHKRQAVPNQPGAAAQKSPGTPALRETPAAAPGADTRPPSPGEGYYWCENCKTYHRRKPASQRSVEDLIVGGATNSPNRNPLIGPAGAKR